MRGGAKLFGLDIDEPPEPKIKLEEYVNGDRRLEIGSLKFEVLYLPGHTQGHVAFYQKDDGVIFSGDVLFQGSIGRTDLPGGNYEQLISSIQTQLLTLPDSTIVYSGHGEPTTVGEERETNPFLS
jgi:glyoxylase-like metal-dependent hydrolase (beta-lactamase superfamily II)